MGATEFLADVINNSTLIRIISALSAIGCFTIAATHYSDLYRNTILFSYPDRVFPLLSAFQVYGAFAILLTLQAIGSGIKTIHLTGSNMCGRMAIRLSIFNSLGILMYRGGSAFLGHKDCRCLGELGLLLHLTKSQEKVALIISFFLIAILAILRLFEVGLAAITSNPAEKH